MILELHPNEVALILAIRKRFRHGEVVMVVRNGVPQYIKKAWESLDFLHPDDPSLTKLNGRGRVVPGPSPEEPI